MLKMRNAKSNTGQQNVLLLRLSRQNIPQFERTGKKANYGKRSHSSVINALRRFSEFLNETNIQAESAKYMTLMSFNQILIFNRNVKQNVRRNNAVGVNNIAYDTHFLGTIRHNVVFISCYRLKF